MISDQKELAFQKSQLKQFQHLLYDFQKGYLMTQAPPGSIELIDFNAKNFDIIEEAISYSDVNIRNKNLNNHIKV